MSSAVLLRRSSLFDACLLISVIQFVCVSKGGATTYTYNIVNYPEYQADNSGGTDTISGTILTDSNSGPITTANLVGGTITLSNTTGSYPIPISDFSTTGLVATPADITLPLSATGSPTYFVGSIQRESLNGITSLEYSNQYDYPTQFAYVADVVNGFGQYNATFPLVFSFFRAPQDFVIATATPTPEPATLTLLGSALLVFGVVYLRRRRAAKT